MKTHHKHGHRHEPEGGDTSHEHPGTKKPRLEDGANRPSSNDTNPWPDPPPPPPQD